MYPYQNRIPTESRTAYSAMCKRLGIKEGDLAICIKAESNFSTIVKTPNGSATGIIQFTEATAQSLGTSTAKIKLMTFGQQLVFVEKYIKLRITETGIKNPDLYNLYLLIHYPKAAGKADSYVLYARPSTAYSGNSGIDKNQDGSVTVREVKAFLDRSKPEGYITAAFYQPIFWAFLLTIGIGVTWYYYNKPITSFFRKLRK
jgi:hypothetical protein